jgi:diguanylate cyclase (GGDEF)-like protein
MRRPTDYAFRLGGDEFGVLLIDAEPPEETISLIELIRVRIMKLAITHVGNDAGIVTGSFGLAFSRGLMDASRDSLYRDADLALYRAKKGGRNRVEVTDAQGWSRPGSMADRTIVHTSTVFRQPCTGPSPELIGVDTQ